MEMMKASQWEELSAGTDRRVRGSAEPSGTGSGRTKRTVRELRRQRGPQVLVAEVSVTALDGPPGLGVGGVLWANQRAANASHDGDAAGRGSGPVGSSPTLHWKW